MYWFAEQAWIAATIILQNQKGGFSMTQLTWCDGCGEDMHANGGRSCAFCGEEYCSECILQHEMNCEEDDREEE